MPSNGAVRNEVIMKAVDFNLRFGEKVILRDINVEVRNVTRPGFDQGQIIAFLGPSGIGKTQFSQGLAGIQDPEATVTGSVLIGNPGIPVRRGMVGMVDQHYHLFKHRTVWGNLMIAGKQKGLRYRERKDLALSYLERFGLMELKNMYPKGLSGGQRQRVSIIQQLICSDNYLIMDEPFSGLDPMAKATAIENIRKVSLMDEFNTIIIISHDIQSALSLADIAWIMGRDRDASGEIVVPGAHIKEQIDLIELDLCYDTAIKQNPRFIDLLKHVEDKFQTL